MTLKVCLSDTPSVVDELYINTCIRIRSVTIKKTSGTAIAIEECSTAVNQRFPALSEVML